MNNSEGVEHLDSVHDNPFVRKFGIDLSHREQKDYNVRKASVDSLTTADNDSEQEYHVNSGFVNKLRSKFTQLQNESSHKVTLSRKSASLENLLSESHYSSSSYGYKSKGKNNVTYDDSHTSKQPNVQLRKKPTTAVKLYSRPRSSDEISTASDKPPTWKKKDTDNSTQNHFVRGAVKPPIPKKKLSDTAAVRKSRNSASEITKHKIEHHDWKVAPDLEKIGRDNIVIIESSSPCIKRKNDKTEQPITKPEISEKQDDFRHVKPVRDKPTDENELPKPNTVSAFRSLFENTKKGSDVIHSWRNQSPTGTSAGSESPNVSSPVSTPRSPLVRMNDENVFEKSIKSDENKMKENVYSPRNSYSNDSSNLAHSPRNSSAEIVQNVDTSSTSVQTSLEVFEAAEKDKQQNGSHSFIKNKHAHTEAEGKPVKSLSPTPLSPRIAAGLSPNYPLTNIFDSKSVIKPDKPKRPKPAVIARKQDIPKDTIELKHEADKKKHPDLPNLVIRQDTDKIHEKSEPETDISANQQSNDKRSGRNSGKIYPRKTQIFDSSNIVKKDRPAPKFASSPSEKQFRSSPVSDETPKESAEMKSRKEPNEPNVSTNQIEQKEFKDPQTGVKLIKTNIVVKKELPNNKEQTKTKFKAPMVPYEGEQKESAKQRSKPVDDTTSPVTGMSSYLANKLKKNQPESNGTTTALTNGSLPSPAPRKRQAPGIPIANGTIKSTETETPSPPPLPVTPEPVLPKTNIDDIMKRKKRSSSQVSSKMVFDSSNIVKSKKEPPKRKPIRKTLEELNKDVMSEPTVPLLDLSSLTNDKPETEYQEGYIPTEIKPCPFKFIGAEVTFESSPFKKRKKAGAKLAFDDKATKTFEYEAEETALENYLQDHPEEREEAERQDEEGFMASIQSSENLMNDTPMAPEQEPATSMKSNTVIGMSAGALTNYKSKIQVQEFQFGVSQEPDFFMLNNVTNDETDEDNMNLLPADSSDLDAFSAETGKADLLF